MAEFNILRAAMKGDWKTVINECKSQPHLAEAAPTTITGDTLIHIAVRGEGVDVVGDLLELLPERVRRAANAGGNTSVHEAVRTGNVDMAKLILERDESLLERHNQDGETPLFWAAMYGRKEMLLFLSGRGMNGTRRNDGATILHAAIVGEFYADLALEIMEISPELAFATDEHGMTGLHLLCLSPSSFKSRTIYSRRYVGLTPILSLETIAIVSYACIPMAAYVISSQERESSHPLGFKQRLKDHLISACPGLRDVYIAKEKHTRAVQLADRLILEEANSNYEDDERRDGHSTEKPLILAMKSGILELVEKIVEDFPESIESVDKDGKTLLHLAVEHRHDCILELLKKMKTAMAKMVVAVDVNGNTVLHLAAILGKDRPQHAKGPAHQMQWETIWFQRVKKLCPKHIHSLPDKNKKAASQVFTESHSDLLKEGEKWAKEVCNICIIMSTLSATVMFAAVFTIPGGNVSDTGLPVLLHEEGFIPFIQYVAISLFSALMSLGVFLAIYTCRFDENEFYARLPAKILVGATMLFYSVVFTVLAFCQGFILVTEWSSPTFMATIDIVLAGVGLTLSVNVYLNIILCPMSYLFDILFM